MGHPPPSLHCVRCVQWSKARQVGAAQDCSRAVRGGRPGGPIVGLALRARVRQLVGTQKRGGFSIPPALITPPPPSCGAIPEDAVQRVACTGGLSASRFSHLGFHSVVFDWSLLTGPRTQVPNTQCRKPAQCQRAGPRPKPSHMTGWMVAAACIPARCMHRASAPPRPGCVGRQSVALRACVRARLYKWSHCCMCAQASETCGTGPGTQASTRAAMSLGRGPLSPGLPSPHVWPASPRLPLPAAAAAPSPAKAPSHPAASPRPCRLHSRGRRGRG